MAVEFNRTDYSGHFPEIWRGDCKILPGGFKPAQEFPTGTVIRRGTPIFVDFDNMTAAVCKTGTVINGGTTTAPRVAKGHLFVAGDTVSTVDGTVAVTVKSVDTSNTEYDVITFSKDLTGVAADDILIECGEISDEDTATPLYEPNMIVGSELDFTGKGLPTIDAAYDAVVLTPSLGAPMLSEWLNGVCLKNNPNIIYIKQ